MRDGETMAEEKRILAVDDDESIRRLLFTILRRRGLPVDTAKDGADAINRLERCAYSLVLLDLMMPRVSGWEVLDYLERRERTKRPAVIVLTAGPEPRNFNPDLVVGSIRKPFDVELLLDTVTACVAVLQGQQQLPGCPPPESTAENLPKNEE